MQTFETVISIYEKEFDAQISYIFDEDNIIITELSICHDCDVYTDMRFILNDNDIKADYVEVCKDHYYDQIRAA